MVDPRRLKPIGCVETSLANCQPTPRNIPREWRLQLLRWNPEILSKDFTAFKKILFCIRDTTWVWFVSPFAKLSKAITSVGRGIALLFHDRGTRRGWVVSSTPRPHFTPGKTRYPLYRRLNGPRASLDRCGKSHPYQDFDPRTPQPVARSLYRLSYRAYSIW